MRDHVECSKITVGGDALFMRKNIILEAEAVRSPDTSLNIYQRGWLENPSG